jgi:hypothetical protein
MVNKCLYCKIELTDGRVVDICDCCGEGVWSKKMFATIKANTSEAMDNNDLCHNRTSDDVREPEAPNAVEQTSNVVEQPEFTSEFSL